MKRTASFCLFFLGIGSAFSQEPAGLVESARAILDGYHAENPEPTDRKLHVICWRPMDRDYAENFRERIPKMLAHIQQFYADEMERHGFGRRTFNLDRDDDGELVIHLAKGDGNFADYQKPDGQRVKNDCWPVLRKAGINPDRETVLIFTNLSNWDPENNTFDHKSPYYANGNHLRGTAWQLDSPELEPGNMALKEPMIEDGEYGRISLGKHNSIFIGGIAHELGHGLGLPHCRERRDEKNAHGTALMGSGNRTYFDELRGEGKGTFLTLAHALRLASHPQFSGSIKGAYLPARAEFVDLAVDAEAARFALRGKIDCPIPVYAVLAYLDPAGRGDYDAKTHAVVPDAEGNFEIECTALWPRAGAGDVRLTALLANGATSTWRSSYRFAEGKLDVSVMRTTFELAEFLAALDESEFRKAKEIADGLREGKSKKIAALILQGYRKNRPTVTAAEVEKSRATFPLSHVTPASEAVGWQRPAYDHLPRRGGQLLVSGGEIFETGIYAHAEARHEYDVAEAGWKKLVGKCGLPSQRGGSVVFVIKTDGNEVFRSPKMEPGALRKFEIDLDGVGKIELITEDAGDGKAVDWGVWFEPVLVR